MNLDNNINLTGRLTKDATIFDNAESNKMVANFTLAVNRNYKDKDGNKPTDFIQCVMFGKRVENFRKFAFKGALISINGELWENNYERNGVKQYTKQVVVGQYQIREYKNKDMLETASDPFTPDADHFGNQTPSYNMNNIDDELPF